MISRLNGGSSAGSYVGPLKKRLVGSPAVRRYCTPGSHETHLDVAWWVAARDVPPPITSLRGWTCGPHLPVVIPPIPILSYDTHVIAVCLNPIDVGRDLNIVPEDFI